MTNYNDFDDDQITYYVYNLNWHLPQEIQNEAMEMLSHLPPEKVGMLLPTYGKECWENAVHLLKEMGYPRNKEALPKLAGLLQDRNWPGALEAIQLFEELGTTISVPHIEKECEKAAEAHDGDWLEHLYFAVEQLGIDAHDFRNPVLYETMKKAAEVLD
ncbi:hypothetical protein [Sporosarcina cyprini]|uniref:hypothetical protein n=1 Tax=Sporosarcina cyprini TaxID=2910523 RepID=UPI001EDD84DE|nr:hypothetical protein [Sporosarcina cyprini]MCG3088241.1 hypothetical protein [Sporosarcina cyprini]